MAGRRGDGVKVGGREGIVRKEEGGRRKEEGGRSKDEECRASPLTS
jgi:hypothetical protein